MSTIFKKAVKRLLCKSDAKRKVGNKKDLCNNDFWCIGLCRFCGLNDCVNDEVLKENRKENR